MNKVFKIIIVLLSIIIIVTCAYYKTLKEGLTNNKTQTIILIGDSVLNNENYVQSGKSVSEQLQNKFSNVINLSNDGATIQDLYGQIDNISNDLNNSSTYIFISSGGNDILNKKSGLSANELTNIFNLYLRFIKSLKTKLPNAKINILNLYLPTNPKYQSYKSTIDTWNTLIEQNSKNIGEMYIVVDIHSVLTSSEDFVYDIEPSEKGSEKIANIIYSTYSMR